LKLDLHTHCREATSCPTPTRNGVERIVAAVKAAGLDGIAVTEHYTERYAYEVKEIVDRHFRDEIVVIPGQELDRMFFGQERGVFHVVELYLPDDATFRFVAHPGHPYVRDLDARIDDSIHGIELRNGTHAGEMGEEMIRLLAVKHDLMLLTNSDAHSLGDIGSMYNELDLEELSARARSSR
jgi:predicted metal-dependent phosphoesterase TrpH